MRQLSAISRQPSTISVVVVLVTLVTGCSRNGFEGFFSSGQRYLAANRFADAAIEFQNAARVNPQSSAAQVKLGDAYSSLKQTSAAAAAYQRACTLDPRDVYACVQAAGKFLALGDFQNAIVYARTALSADQYSLDGQLILGSALAGIRRFAEAEERLEAALALAPDDSRPYAAIGEMHGRRGNVKVAEVWLQKAVERDPKSADAHVALAQVLLDTGRKAEGERELRAAVAARPDDARANELLASYLVDTDRCDDAEPYWKAVAASTTDGSGALALADFYVSRGRSDDALHALSSPSAKGQEQAAKSRMASILYDRGERSKAAQLVNELLEQHQSDVNALLLKARIALDQNDVAKAREYAHRAAEITPDAPAVRNMLATATAAGSNK